MTTAIIPHILMTRFNLATPGREAGIRNKPDWLASRFDLFEQFCLPSVGAQTSRTFTWIVYFDKDTPETFKTRVRELQKQVPFEAYYTGLFPASGWPQSLHEVLGALPPVVLTSRLDNDDALANDYMERTLQAAQGRKPDPRIGIVITNGFIRSTSRAYTISHSCNAFTSWLERTENPNTLMTAMGIAHMDAEASGPLVQVPGEGGWLQVVHGGNVSNKVRGQRIAPDQLVTRFHPGALVRLETASPGQIVLENSILTPLRDGRDRLMGLARRVRGTVR